MIDDGRHIDVKVVHDLVAGYRKLSCGKVFPEDSRDDATVDRDRVNCPYCLSKMHYFDRVYRARTQMRESFELFEQEPTDEKLQVVIRDMKAWLVTKTEESAS